MILRGRQTSGPKGLEMLKLCVTNAGNCSPFWDLARTYYKGLSHLLGKHTSHDSVRLFGPGFSQENLSPFDSDSGVSWTENEDQTFLSFLPSEPFPDPSVSPKSCVCSPHGHRISAGLLTEVTISQRWGRGWCSHILPMGPYLLMSFFQGWS